MTEPPHPGWQQPQPPQQQPPHQGWQQPQPGYQPQPPQGGYSLPPGYVPGGVSQAFQPPPVTKRIPDDLPFVVRNSIRKRALVWGGVDLVFASLCGCGLGGLAGSDASGSDAIGSGGGFLVGALAFAGVAVLLGAVFGLQLWIIASGGPVLAASPAGMWIKTRPTRGQAIWLPWEGILQISRRRWSLEKMVVVKPRDPRATNNLGAFTAVDSSMLQLFYGSGFTATLNFADKPEAEIMGALAQLSAGRTALV